MIAGDRMIMNDHGSSRLCRSVVGLTASLMVGAAIGFRILRQSHAHTFPQAESARDASTSLNVDSISTK